MNIMDYLDFEYCKKAIDSESTFYNSTKIATIHVLLKSNTSIDEKKRKLSGSEIWENIKKDFGNMVDEKGKFIFPDQQRDTLIQYLYKHVRDSQSPINRNGQRKGFYIDMNKISNLQQDDFVSDENNNQTCIQANLIAKTKISREMTLYPVLQSWLVTNQYQAADISSGKLNGRWGNPDVAGIRVSESFRGITVELITIEAKISSKDWQVTIFEAISHRRFANRVYFAYAEPKSRQFVQLEDIKYYSELYEVGVIKLLLEDSDYNQLINGNACKALSSSDVEIIEICSARFNTVQEQFQLKFCENLGIKSTKDLYSWGKSDR